MGRMGTCLATMSLAFAVGCAGGERSRLERSPGACLHLAGAGRPTSSLLFDRATGPALQPGIRPITAEDFACRSLWPSTSGYYSGGEVVFFRERYYDHQDGGTKPTNYVDRHFESYRTGMSFR